MNIQEIINLKIEGNSVYPTVDDKWRAIRAERNKVLRDCDWVVIKAQELNEAIPSNYVTYRDKLRNIPQDYQVPEEVIFPEI